MLLFIFDLNYSSMSFHCFAAPPALRMLNLNIFELLWSYNGKLREFQKKMPNIFTGITHQSQQYTSNIILNSSTRSPQVKKYDANSITCARLRLCTNFGSIATPRTTVASGQAIVSITDIKTKLAQLLKISHIYYKNPINSSITKIKNYGYIYNPQYRY